MPTGAGIQYLGMPGQVTDRPTQDLLASAPWLFVVYMAFQQHWPPMAVLGLVAVLTPIILLGTRPAIVGLRRS